MTLLNYILSPWSQIATDLFYLWPELALSLGCFGLLLFPTKGSSKIHAAWALAVTMVALLLLAKEYSTADSQMDLFAGQLHSDAVRYIFRGLVLFALGLGFWIMGSSKESYTKTWILLMLALGIGANIWILSAHFATWFLGMETVSLCSYLLVALHKPAKSAESALKYLLFGAAASAVTLFGISWWYGLTHTFTFSVIENPSGLIYVSLALIITSVWFKLQLFPFHFWVPDVYQGAQPLVLAFLSILPKIAAAAVFVQLLRLVPFQAVEIQHAFGVALIASFAIGNMGALLQKNIVRLLAFSGVSHSAFFISAFWSGTLGNEAGLFYLFAYIWMNVGVFFWLYLENRDKSTLEVSDLDGLGKTHPMKAFALTVMVLAFAGLPFTVGFTSKVLVFSSLYQFYQTSGNIMPMLTLAMAAISTVIGFYYYLQIPFRMFVKESSQNIHSQWNFWENLLVILLVSPLVILFFTPQWLNNLLKLINLV